MTERTFAIISITKSRLKGGEYTGTPDAAAKKMLRRAKKTSGTVKLQETTSGSSAKMYSYSVKRKTLNPPLEYKVKDGKKTKTIRVKYTFSAKSKN